MSLQSIEKHIAQKLTHVTRLDTSGYTFFFYGPDQMIPFTSIIASDNDYDQLSDLNRDGVFRVNIGVSNATYEELFPDDAMAWDYTELNRFMPHPDYAAQHFICVLCPVEDVLSETMKFIEEAYLIAKKRFEKKQANLATKQGSAN